MQMERECSVSLAFTPIRVFLGSARPGGYGNRVDTETRGSSETSGLSTPPPSRSRTKESLETREAMFLGAISTEEWLRSEDIAHRAGISGVQARRRLLQMVKDQEVEVAEFPNEQCGGVHNRYRGLREGSLAPLFSNPTIDPRALAECWGGYSYVKKG